MCTFDQTFSSRCRLRREARLRVAVTAVPFYYFFNQEWDGCRPTIQVDGQKAIITLTERENSRVPVNIVRQCGCLSSGRSLHAVQWLLRQRERGSHSRLFPFTTNTFVNRLRMHVRKLGMGELRQGSTHAFGVVWLRIY